MQFIYWNFWYILVMYVVSILQLLIYFSNFNMVQSCISSWKLEVSLILSLPSSRILSYCLASLYPESFEKDLYFGKSHFLLLQCQSLIEELSASHSTDLQQRAYELQAVIGLDVRAIGSIMPSDASCEDIEVILFYS
jgi:hypothetical protein